MKVRDIALKDTICVQTTSTVNEMASTMKRHNIGAVGVCSGTKLVGVVTDRDIVIGCLASSLEPRTCPAKDIMTSNPVSVSPDMALEDAAKLMGREQVRRLPVVEGDKVIGMLSMGDIAFNLPCDDQIVADTLRRVSSPTHAVPVC